MNNVDVIIIVILVVLAILHLGQVWVDQNAFVLRMKRIRSFLNRVSFGLLLPKWVQEGFDNNPESEILFARILSLILRFAIFFVLFISLS